MYPPSWETGRHPPETGGESSDQGKEEKKGVYHGMQTVVDRVNQGKKAIEPGTCEHIPPHPTAPAYLK